MELYTSLRNEELDIRVKTFIENSDINNKFIQIDNTTSNVCSNSSKQDYRRSIFKCVSSKYINDKYYVSYSNNIISPIRDNFNIKTTYGSDVNGILIVEQFRINKSDNYSLDLIKHTLSYYKQCINSLDSKDDSAWLELIKLLENNINTARYDDSVIVETSTFIDRKFMIKYNKCFISQIGIGIYLGVPNIDIKHPLHNITKDVDEHNKLYNNMTDNLINIKIIDNTNENHLYFIRFNDQNIIIKSYTDIFKSNGCTITYPNQNTVDIKPDDYIEHGIYSSEAELKLYTGKIIKEVKELEHNLNRLDYDKHKLETEQRSLDVKLEADTEKYKHEKDMMVNKAIYEMNKFKFEKELGLLDILKSKISMYGKTTEALIGIQTKMLDIDKGVINNSIASKKLSESKLKEVTNMISVIN